MIRNFIKIPNVSQVWRLVFVLWGRLLCTRWNGGGWVWSVGAMKLHLKIHCVKKKKFGWHDNLEYFSELFECWEILLLIQAASVDGRLLWCWLSEKSFVTTLQIHISALGWFSVHSRFYSFHVVLEFIKNLDEILNYILRLLSGFYTWYSTCTKGSWNFVPTMLYMLIPGCSDIWTTQEKKLCTAPSSSH